MIEPQTAKKDKRRADAHRKLGDKLISRNEAAGFFNCSIETLRRKEARGILNPIRIDKRLVRYRWSEIEALLESKAAK